MAIDRSPGTATSATTDGAELVIERTFDVPRDGVWEAFTAPERVLRWWGLIGTTTTVHQLDLHVGGAWRFVNHAASGEDAQFKGTFREIDAPARLVYSFTVDAEGLRDREAIVTVTFEEQDAATKVTGRTRFPTKADLERALSMGLSARLTEGWDRLAELLASG
jgi:uncharacterized protein YndB with AHSA1/START domain